MRGDLSIAADTVVSEPIAFAAAYKAVNAQTGRLAIEALDQVGVLRPGGFATAAALLAAVTPQARYLLQSVLRILVEDGEIAADATGFCRRPASMADQDERTTDPGQTMVTDDPFFRLMNRWREGLADFLAGRRSGIEILFRRGDILDWAALHGSSHVMGHYAKIGAALTFAASQEGARVLEIGGGTGAALRNLLAHGAIDALGEYCFTDVSPAFFVPLRRDCPRQVVFRTFDFDRPPSAQGLETAAYDVVLGVNALHVARDLPAAVGHVSSLLRPGGRLILAEGTPAHDGSIWRPDLLFAMFPGWWNVCLHPELRPRSGFLTLREWERILGLHHLALDHASSQKTFRVQWFGGALTARRTAG
jgi:SAM-dependent methyltransferase